MKVYILASKGISFSSKLIKWYQFGFEYTHIAYITSLKNKNNPEVIEAWFPAVRKGYFFETHTPGTRFTVFSVKVTEKQKETIEKFLHQQIGTPYDLVGLLTFITRSRKLAKNKRWFCSELVFTAFQKAGIDLLYYTNPETVSPALLLKSPYLIKEFKV